MKKIISVLTGMALIGLILSSGNSEEDLIKKAEPTQAPKVEEVKKSDYEVIEELSLYTEHEMVKVTGIIKNTSNEVKEYTEVRFFLYDSDGNRIDEDFTNTTDLQPGETWKINTWVADEAVDVKLNEITESAW